MELQNFFPRLRQYELTSADTANYNCIAWAAGDASRWWEPFDFCYWPDGVPYEFTIGALIQLFKSLGYERCNGAKYEQRYEKVAVFAEQHPLARCSSVV